MRYLLVGSLFFCACSSPKQSPKQKTVDRVDPETNVEPVREKTDLERWTEDLEGTDLHATIETSLGTLECDLYETRAPFTVTNFVGLARGFKVWVNPETEEQMKGSPYYDGLTFHRIVPGFFVQTGDPLANGEGGPGYQFADEFHPELRHDRVGILSMANRGPNTNGGQFFILAKPTPHFDDHHSVFGECESADLVKKLNAVPTDSDDKPVNPPKLIKISIVAK